MWLLNFLSAALNFLKVLYIDRNTACCTVLTINNLLSLNVCRIFFSSFIRKDRTSISFPTLHGNNAVPCPDAGRREQPWMSGRSPCYVAKAAFSFEARQEDELSFGVGEVLAMAPADQQPLRNQGWMLATRLRDANNAAVPKPSHVGLVPTNHFRTLYQSEYSIRNV